MFNLFSKKSKSILGVDFGTSVIKIAELSRHAGKYNLDAYGLAKMEIGKETQRNVKEVSEVLKELLVSTQVKSNKAYIAIPEAFTFTALVELPMMPEAELAKAIPFEARKYIPIPEDQIYLEWIILPPAEVAPAAMALPNSVATAPIAPKNSVLLIAVMRDAVDNFMQIASSVNLSVIGFEIESFSLMRAVLGEEADPILIVDVGTHSINIDTIDGGFLRFNYEQELPMLANRDNPIIQKQIIDSIVLEVQRAINLYLGKTGKKIERCIIAGGGSFITGLVESFTQRLGVIALQANPFSGIIYPEVLKPAVDEIGPSLSVAIGLAKR